MPSAISLEYLTNISGANNGLATLDSSGKVPNTQLPLPVQVFKGTYATLVALQTAYATAQTGCYAYVTETNGYYYWNSSLSTPAWTSQTITATAYNALTSAQKGEVPYIIIP